MAVTVSIGREVDCFVGRPLPFGPTNEAEGHALMQDTGLIRQFRPSIGHTQEVRP
jgi:hypothetical protein